MVQLSIIIPTRNRDTLLRNTLESICKQTFPKTDFEVIINDNGSTDDTKAVVESFASKIPNLIYHYDAKPGLHVGRHNGYKLSRSEILVYADDDIEAFPTWLEGIYESFSDPNVMLVGGKDLPKYEQTPPFWVEEQWYKINDIGHVYGALSLIDLGNEIIPISPFYVYGCNYSIRKKIIKEAGGFHPDGVPFSMIEYRGDGEFYINKYIYERGYKVIYNPKASVYHIVTKDRMTIDYLKRRAFRAGVEKSYADKRYSSLRRTISQILQRAITICLNIFSGEEKSEYSKQIKESFKIGYRFHDCKYKHSKELRDWVHKDNYF